MSNSIFNIFTKSENIHIKKIRNQKESIKDLTAQYGRVLFIMVESTPNRAMQMNQLKLPAQSGINHTLESGIILSIHFSMV